MIIKKISSNNDEYNQLESRNIYWWICIEKYNLHEYSPHTGTDLNVQYTDIRIEIQN